jgi:hypothetical protein
VAIIDDDEKPGGRSNELKFASKEYTVMENEGARLAWRPTIGYYTKILMNHIWLACCARPSVIAPSSVVFLDLLLPARCVGAVEIAVMRRSGVGTVSCGYSTFDETVCCRT